MLTANTSSVRNVDFIKTPMTTITTSTSPEDRAIQNKQVRERLWGRLK